jgi:hypothetical protein
MMIFAPCQHLRMLLVASAARSANSAPDDKLRLYVLETIDVSRRADAADWYEWLSISDTSASRMSERGSNDGGRRTILHSPPNNDNLRSYCDANG